MSRAGRTPSLRARLLVLVLGLVTVVWLGAAVWTWRDAQHELDELLDGHLAQAAALLVVQQQKPDHDDEQVDALVLHRYAPRVAFQVFHEGRLVLRSAQAGVQPMAPRSDGFATVRLADGSHWRVFATRGAEQDVQVYVGEQLGARRAILRAVLAGVLWPLAIALPLLGVAGWWAVRRGLGPLQRLSDALAQRQPDALTPVTDGALPAELRPLVDALNALFARIARLLDAERRFTADAAHELRTPIAAIRAQAQVALGARGDEGQRTHALQATLAGCDRATHLVEQLLTLARVEGQPGTAAQVDLGAVVRELLAHLAPQALARDQTLELQADGPCSVSGNAPLLGILVRNLVDNALRYSPPGAQVRVTLQADGAGCELRVDDSGPGLPEDVLPRLGERFYRPPGQTAPGSGLGWSIVRRIAHVSGATIRLAPSPDLGGLQVRVTWPAPAAGASAGRE